MDAVRSVHQVDDRWSVVFDGQFADNINVLCKTLSVNVQISLNPLSCGSLTSDFSRFILSIALYVSVYVSFSSSTHFLSFMHPLLTIFMMLSIPHALSVSYVVMIYTRVMYAHDYCNGLSPAVGDNVVCSSHES